MTVMEFQARRIERIGEALAHFLATTRTDRLDWRPATGEASQTRSALEQVAECVRVNRAMAALLRGESVPSPAAMPAVAFTEAEEAQNQLLDSARELAAAIRGLREEDMAREFTHWRGTMPGEVLIEMPYRNMAYHAGQINMIQLLYGDTEFHMPPARTP